jgi:hypothetical protein
LSHAFYVDSNTIKKFCDVVAPEVYDEIDNILAESAQNCDSFITLFKNLCCRDVTNQIAYLFNRFLEYSPSSVKKINFKWISSEILQNDNGLKEQFLSLRNKLIKENASYIKELVVKVGSLDGLAASLKSSEHGKKTKSNEKYVLENIVSI